jgi:hypothetical protein
MTGKMCCLLGAVALGSCVVSTRLEAQTADERVFFTFSAPIELPGRRAPGRTVSVPAPGRDERTRRRAGPECGRQDVVRHVPDDSR